MKWVFIPFGQMGALGFTVIAAAGVAIQAYVARWYREMLDAGYTFRKSQRHGPSTLPAANVFSLQPSFWSLSYSCDPGTVPPSAVTMPSI